MKKNFAMRIAACLLVVTMLSLCMVSYTYAKYTTQGDDQNDAKVAAWGVNVAVELDDLFAAEYDAANGTVKAAGTYNLLAPGTKKTAAAVKVTGTPEVSTEILPTVTVALNNWEVEGAYYCPLIVKVNNVAVATATDAATYAANIKAAIETAIKGVATDGKYAPNTDLSDKIGTVTVEWEWPFEVDDAKDTILGNADTKATFDLTIEVTVNQVD